MPVDVTLRFIPPDDNPDVAALLVFEAPEKDGPYTQIDRTDQVGEFPDFINYFVTEQATSKNDWFAIAWEDASGSVGALSDSVQGQTESVIVKLISRVVLRDPSLNERMVAQVSEFVVSDVMGALDPYDTSLVPSYRQMEAMTLLVLARSRYQTLLVGGENYTAGLVSEKDLNSDESKIMKSIEALVREADRILGRRFSIVAQMCVPEINRGLSRVVMADISRLQIDVE